MEHPEAFGAFAGLWSILESSEHPVAFQGMHPWGAQTLSPVGSPGPLGASQCPLSTPSSWEHPGLLGTPWDSGNPPDSWEHPELLGTPQAPGITPPAHECPEDPPASLHQQKPLSDPPSPWEPLELSGAPQGVPELAQLPPPCRAEREHPTDSTHCSPFPVPQPPGRAGRCRKEFPTPPEFPKPLFFIKIKSDTSLSHSAVQGLLQSCDLQEKSPQRLQELKKPIMGTEGGNHSFQCGAVRNLQFCGEPPIPVGFCPLLIPPWRTHGPLNITGPPNLSWGGL